MSSLTSNPNVRESAGSGLNNWQACYDEFMRRIREKVWQPGELIPNETVLASELKTSRVTVNRALREVANAGFLERRRKAGTRVVENPVRRAVLDIPVIRQEIEAAGFAWSHRVLSRDLEIPPEAVANRMHATVPGTQKTKFIRLQSIHYADANPYLFEDRWINCATLPSSKVADFERLNANEWLVQNAQFTKAEISFNAENATMLEVNALDCAEGTAILVVNRTTWLFEKSITSVRLCYHPGYKIDTTL